MSETFQELADIPKDFVREGSQFVRRCTKRMSIPRPPQDHY
jgi:protein transport protein SEC61 subunit gamma-like protein